MANLTAQLNSIDRKLLAVLSFGLLLSMFGLYVELKHDSNESYVALCDISQSVSCSAAFTSKFGKGFGLLPEAVAFKNPIFGICFYIFLMALVVSCKCKLSSQLLLVMSLISNFGSIYLAYILAVVLKVLCVVCIGIYVINITTFVLAYKRYNIVKQICLIESCKKSS